MVKPFQAPHPPIVVTVVEPSSASAAYAGSRGWGIISGNFLLPQWVPTHWNRFVEGCEAVGRTPDPAAWRVAKTIFVADDERTAAAYGTGRKSPYRFYYEQLGGKLIRAGRANLFKTDPDMPDGAVTTDLLVDELVIAGTVDVVVDKLRAFCEAVGPFGTLLYCGIDWADSELARRSLELMANEVMPRLTRALVAASDGEHDVRTGEARLTTAARRSRP
jgi:alkanesulfonate monooxygenase SsuD/methylene tetrahydromethanopterin reductase-like flavin-dependent oxidoreductase (luciferase family)